ncbi:DNA phosphorothioation-associated putative methyltransferase [Colwellia sp. C1TZA3]|uniref:DNA phosphorothioation-associated putative methyltransferase n=1 Tax=Colwellia sp. C1TZA3 TaxID=2508879 RepID=UPI0011BA3FB4|nr:DNA phosphorothioation-associated putative methyltransferase [Colwellia sp. C1TZA3]TWX72210.1 DNA phosphorothioation-associated putative methyltransferase [Colwellia sp. C1TZA3]
MNAEQFKELVNSLDVGKKLPDSVYFHKDTFSDIPAVLSTFIKIVAKALKIDDDNWNLIKVFRKDFRLSLLNYPLFFEDSYPALEQSVNVDLKKLSHRVTSYSEQENPPILHRKETMVSKGHESYNHFCILTQEGEAAGLYENSRMIGFKNSWERLIVKHGYELVDGRLFRSSAVISNIESEKEIDRHKTAIVRHELSAPMKTLAKNGFLSGEYSIFDYGCGRGDDLRELEAHGLDALGWDPKFCPDSEIINSDLVNIGFVINVIEDQDERIDAILGAWEATGKLLIISAMLANESYLAQFIPYKDGVITSRNTFQKYFSQAELKLYIERTLDEEPIAISPGIFYVFKDKNLEQHFLQNRHKRSYQWQQKTAPRPVSEDQERLLFTQHHELLESFWLSCLAYGRVPANDEFSKSDEIKEIIGSNKKALKLVTDWFGQEELALAENMRKEDLLIYFALAMFEGRKSYTHLPDDLKRDIKALFDTHKIALHQAKELLFDIANIERITAECIKAKEILPASKLTLESGKPHSLTLHKKFIDELSPLLRVYVYSALQLYGELDDIQLVKIHITSGKVSLLGYEGFEDSPLPQLKERVKIKMADQDVDFFDYIKEEKRPVLLNKIEYIDESFDDFKKQKAFNKRLNKELKGLSKNNKPMTKLNIGSLLLPKHKVRGYQLYKLKP